MSALYPIIAAVALQRLLEACYAHRNTKRLLREGACEVGAAHYPLFILLHVAWLASIALVVDPAAAPDLVLLGFYGVLQLGRLWVLLSLGRYWTTRVIVVPGASLVTRGPYRYLKHPNYLIVCAEIATLPLVFGAWPLAFAFSILNGALLYHRMRVENAALAGKRTRGGVAPAPSKPPAE